MAVKDLIVLVADGNIDFSIRGVLSRPLAVPAGQPSFSIVRHPERDPGCRLKSAELLKPFAGTYSYALVVFDLEGSGGEERGRIEVERAVEERLEQDWGGGKTAAVAIEPELEAWVWSDSPHVDEVLGWKGRDPGVRPWLRSSGWLVGEAFKPARPKEAMEEALRVARKPRSSVIYKRLAERVSFSRCADPSFKKLLRILREWFPVGPG